MKKKWFKNFKRKYKVVFVHPETMEEKDGFHTSKMKITYMVIFYSLIIIALTTCVIFFTPLRELIPGYTDIELSRQVYRMERRTDSLETVFRQQEQYIENLKRIINGDEIIFNLPKTEKNDTDNLNMTAGNGMLSFFVPVNGLVTHRFNSRNKHYGVDVVAKSDAVIMAAADGTVIFSDWSVEGGYVVGIQHDGNIISVYKHNASLIHHEGDVVKGGDAIAILGGGGTTSTGPHLHFELWFRGVALNPEDYISFEGK